MQQLRGFPVYLNDTGDRMYLIQDLFIKEARKIGASVSYIPIVEELGLFRPLGQHSDVWQKEIFKLNIGNKECALRPETTAGLVRSLIESGIYNGIFITYGPQFRYERPQGGRTRQFYQFCLDWVGQHYYAKQQSFMLINRVMKTIGIDFTIHINNIGTALEREKYISILENFFSKGEFSEEIKKKIEVKNYMGIIDKGTVSAPSILDYVDNTEFNEIVKFLTNEKIPFQINNQIVRGLEYYDNLVFEIKAKDSTYSQNSIGGGGEYNNLFEKMGGKPTKCFGFGIGIDRMLPLAKIQSTKSCIVCFFIEKIEILELLPIQVKRCFKDLKSSFHFANKNKIDFLIIVDEKINNNILTVKDLHSGLQKDIGIDYLWQMNEIFQ